LNLSIGRSKKVDIIAIRLVMQNGRWLGAGD